ncbi:MAG: hypothetical protein LC128_05945 [Chitinophagales bacterium]|nr:hypothetical protein [Chitinophagales bacterium]
MADKEIKLNLTAVDKASEKIKGVNKEIDELGNNTKSQSEKMQMRWTELWSKVQLGVMAFQQVYRAAKEFYNFAREGAELEFTIEKFDRLSESIGTTTEALLKDLKEATDGTMSDMELMGAATDFMTLGLAKSHDEVVRLTTVASQLGMNMNQLVLTLTNQTTMRFDALGVAVDGFDEKVKRLKDSGMDANAAFTEAFLQQAEEQIAKVGSVTDETLGTFMRFEAAIANLATTAKMDAAPAMEGLIKVLTDGINVLGGNKGWASLLDDVNDSISEGIPSYENYRSAINNVLKETGLLVDENGKLIATNVNGAIKLGAARQQVEYLTEAEYNAAVATAEWDEHEKRLADTFAQEVEPAINTVKDATNNAEAAMRTYTEALLFKIASEGLSEEAALQLAYSMGLVDEKTVYATEKVNIYKDMLEQGIITEETFISLTTTLGDEMDKIPSDVNIDFWLKMHGYSEFERLANYIGNQGGSIGPIGRGNKPIAQAAGGDIRPGGSAIVGEHGIEHLRVGYDGTVTVTPVTNNYNNYNLGVTTMQNLDTVTTGFAILQAMQ